MHPRLVRKTILIASAAVTLGGVLFLGWDIRTILFLYWLENVLLGVIQLIKMLTASGEGETRASWRAKLAVAAFFSLHYGGFCAIHGLFIIVLSSSMFGTGGNPDHAGRILSDAADPFGPWIFLTILWGVLKEVARLLPPGAWLALAGIAAGHVVDLVNGYFIKGGRKAGLLGKLMTEPYKHIVVVHIGIIAGAFLTLLFKNAIGVLAIIVIGKLLLDLREAAAPAKSEA